jgi:hypothetical protein
MKPFKFLQKNRIPRVSPGYLKLKDVHNRNKYLLCSWSEYPDNPYEGFIKTFQGNILEFYNMIKDREVYPTVYEVHKQHRGYFDASIVYDNHFRQNLFIGRKFYLTIKYSLM